MPTNESVALDWVPTLLQLATAGGFTAFCWYLVVKHIPAIEARHKDERGEWMNYIQRRDASFEQLAQSTLTSIGEVHSELQVLGTKVDEIS